MDLQLLLEKYKAGALSDGEKLQLLSALDDKDQRAQWEALIEKLYENAPPVDHHDDGVEEMIHSILHPPVRRIFPRWLPYAAAILLLTISIYLLTRTTHNAQPTSTPQIAAKKDILPGGSHAVLTLANGQQIILDSAGAGSLATQGSTHIIKLNAGALTYQSTSNDPAKVFYNTIATPAGGQYQITLADGTIVWLNALSSLHFPTSFNGPDRSVTITGEAYLEVAKDRSKPFIVHVNDAAIEVLGTHFNVMAYNNESALETTLLQGSVKFIKGNSSVLLKPGQQSRLLQDAQIQLLNDVNLEQVVAWKNGMQSFNSADIKTIMRQVERWYDVKVEYKGEITTRKFSGDIPRDAKLSELLEAFKVNRIHFDIDAEHKKLTITP